MTADSSNNKKILFVLFNTNTLDPEIDSKIRRIVSLASNTNLSILFVSERTNSSNSEINYLQDLLRLPRLSDIVEINQDRNWKLLYKTWINSMLKLIFNININVLTNLITEVESIKELQEEMDLLEIIKLSNHFKLGKYQEIINRIERNEKNVVLHQILIDSLLQIYNSDLAIEILEEKKQFYQDHNNLVMWYYFYGKALGLKGKIEDAEEYFEYSLKYSDSETHKDIIKEIKEWTGKTAEII
jgi:tetratricopeptide (TPR) repeat protein